MTSEREGMRFMVFVAYSSFAWLILTGGTQASTVTVDDTPNKHQSAIQPPTIKNPINMDAPMQGGMMKKGMKEGDVKKSAEKKNAELKKMLEMEEKGMPAAPPLRPKR